MAVLPPADGSGHSLAPGELPIAGGAQVTVRGTNLAAAQTGSLRRRMTTATKLSRAVNVADNVYRKIASQAARIPPRAAYRFWQADRSMASPATGDRLADALIFDASARCGMEPCLRRRRDRR